MSEEHQFTKGEMEKLRTLLDAFDEAELEQLRGMLLSDARTVWFWSTIKVWAMWMTAVIVGVSVGWDALKKMVGLLK